MSLCPICDTEVDVVEFDVARHAELRCPVCGANLIVAAVSPVELAPSSESNNESDDYFNEDTNE